MQTKKITTFLFCFLLVASVFAQFQIPEVNAANTNIPESYVYMNGNVNTGTWTNPTYAYNNATANAATKAFTGVAYSTYLVLNCSSLVIGTKIRFWVGRGNTAITTMQIDVANRTGAWLNVYSATPTYSAYANASFTQKCYTAIRMRFYNTGTVSRTASIYEVQAVNSAYTISNILVDLSKWDSVFKISSVVIGNARYNVYSTASGIELDTIFTKKTVIPSITWNIQSSNVVLFYQPPLTSEFIVGNLEGGFKISFVNATDVMNGTRILVHRPISVVGSYAVYSSTKQNNQYGVGKLFHVYRPYLIDALGRTSWANLTITSNALTITLNQTWLNLATFPVIIDPSFGYDTIGKTAWGPGHDYALKNIYTFVACTVSKISIYASGSGGTLKGGLYNGNTFLVSADGAYGGVAGWVDCDIADTNLVASDYGLALKHSDASIQFYYDAGLTNQYRYTEVDALPNPWVTDGTANRRFSIYANYTVVTTKSVTFSCSEISSITTNLGMKKALKFSESQILEVTQTLSYHKALGFRQTETIIMTEATSKTISIRIRNSETSSFLSDLSKRIAITLKLSETPSFILQMNQNKGLKFLSALTVGLVETFQSNKALKFLPSVLVQISETLGMHFGEFLKFLEVSTSETINPTTTMGIQKSIHIKLPLIAEVLSGIYRAIELRIKNLEFPLLETPNFSANIITKSIGNIQGIGGYSIGFVLGFAIIACIITGCVVVALRKKQD